MFFDSKDAGFNFDSIWPSGDRIETASPPKSKLFFITSREKYNNLFAIKPFLYKITKLQIKIVKSQESKLSSVTRK